MSKKPYMAYMVDVLQHEVNRLTHMMKLMDDKLLEFMGEEEHMKFSMDIARIVFKQEIDEMPDGEFKQFVKQFVLENIDEITK